MAKDSFDRPRRISGFVWLLAAVAALAAVYGLFGALRQGPAPTIAIDVDRPAIGRATKIVARFAEARRGLGNVKLELVAGERVVPLGEKQFARRGAYALTRGTPTADAALEATVGSANVPGLQEGEVTIRATADRMAGLFRSKAPIVVERKMAVHLRPPQLAVLSTQHYLRQGGAGVVLIQTSAPQGRSGVVAGDVESLSFPVPGGDPQRRFVLYASPWELSDPSRIKVFAEDEAGNRVEQSFLTQFKPSPARRDTIKIDDAFLQKVVPPIAANTPGMKTDGALIDQYVWINSELRKQILAKIVELSRRTAPTMLWQGPFLQLKNSARRAGFAETRSYVYQGRAVDTETHLGLDLASLAHAEVPAPNAGKVVYAGWFGIYGNAVLIDHGCGLMSLSGHMSSIAVKEGETVARGQTIGASGSTGLAGGDHLHLEIFVQGKSVDPVEWLDEHWIKDNVLAKLEPGAASSAASAAAAPSAASEGTPLDTHRHRGTKTSRKHRAR